MLVSFLKPIDRNAPQTRVTSKNRNTWGAKKYSLKHKINRTKQNKKKTGTIIKAAVKSMSKSIISCPPALNKKIVSHIQKAKNMPEEI